VEGEGVIRPAVALASSMIAAASWAAECVVKEFLVAPVVEQTGPPPVIERRTISSQGVMQAVAVPPRVRPAETSDPGERSLREVQAAIRNRDYAAFMALMPSDASARQALLQRSVALFWAFSSGALPVVKQMIEWDPSALSARSKVERGQLLGHLARGWESARTAAYDQNYVELVRLLLAEDADPDGGPIGWTPIAAIATIPPSAATIEAARILLEHGATVDKRQDTLLSALATAAQRKNAPLVRLMLESRTPRQATLDEAIAETPLEQSNDVIRLLLERGANINAHIPGRPSPNFEAAWLAAIRAKEYGERDLLLLLIRYRVDPNRAKGVNSPLMIVMHDHELMKALLDVGANPNHRGGDEGTALHLALRVPTQITKRPDDARSVSQLAPGLDPAVRRKSVALLLQYGADPTLRDRAGNTPLMLVQREDVDIMQMLMARGSGTVPGADAAKYYRQYDAPVGPVSWALLQRNDTLALALIARDGVSPTSDCGAIYYAARTGSVKTLAALLERKAGDTAARDERGATPLIAAASRGYDTAAKMLLDRGVANVNETTPVRVDPKTSVATGGQTALMAAAAQGHKEVVEELIRRGADVHRVDALGQTAWIYAVRAGALDIVMILERNGARRDPRMQDPVLILERPGARR
jgi:ankyrin repeat protein